MVTNIQNFKMSLYLHLSCSYNAHWLLPWVVLASLLYNLAVWLSCGLTQPGDSLCEVRVSLSTYQLLISLILMAYLIVIYDLVAGKLKSLLAGSGLSQIRERIRKLLRCGNNSVSPVEEFDLNDSRVESQETGTINEDVTIWKDHIR